MNPIRFFQRFFRKRENELKLDFLENREQFIPFRVDVLLDRMLADARLPSEDHDGLRMLRKMLAERFHLEFYETLESLKNDFVPFDPDRETFSEPDYSEQELQEKRIRLYANIIDLLKTGNYVELTRRQLDECLKLQPMGGLSVHVDTDDFDEFHVFYRGVRRREETETSFFLWKRNRTVTSLKRVFVLARYKQETGGRVLMKMFKDVAVENIKIIAPKVKLGMPIFDRIKIGGSVLGSLITPFSKLVFALTFSWIYFLIILGGLLIAAVKGILSFMNSKTKYMQVYSSSLYFRNLSNNKSAITALLDAAEDQEIKEALLGYFILYMARCANPDRKLSLDELDATAEQWIEDRFGHHFDFEVDDAIRKLAEKNILIRYDADLPTFRVYDIPETLRRLDEAGDRRY